MDNHEFMVRNGVRQPRTNGLPPGWQGERSIDGVGLGWPVRRWWPGRRGRVDRLALVNRSADGASVIISSHRAAACARFIDAAVIDDLFGRTGLPRLSGNVAGSGSRGVDDPAWQQASILVDSRPVTFRVLANGSDWGTLLFVGGWREGSSPLDGYGWRVSQMWVVQNLLQGSVIPAPLAEDPAAIERRIRAWRRREAAREARARATRPTERKTVDVDVFMTVCRAGAAVRARRG